MSKNIITEMQQSDQTVHIVSGKVAEPLIAAGLVRRASIDPAPKGGKVAINLTARGRGHRGPVEQPDAPVDGVEDHTTGE